jgi:hypothetical protein
LRIEDGIEDRGLRIEDWQAVILKARRRRKDLGDDDRSHEAPVVVF